VDFYLRLNLLGVGRRNLLQHLGLMNFSNPFKLLCNIKKDQVGQRMKHHDHNPLYRLHILLKYGLLYQFVRLLL
jgi:hypothetical protein